MEWLVYLLPKSVCSMPYPNQNRRDLLRVDITPREVQAGNDITEYRKAFGTTMAYDGGLDKRVLLEGRGAIDRMLESTILYMKDTGGGWCICLDHRVLKDTPLADFQYYLDRARELARY